MLYHSDKGRYQQAYDRFWDELVPGSGQADTVQGELVRAIGRLASELWRNGNINWDDGFLHFIDFLAERLNDPAVFDKPTRDQIVVDLDAIELFGDEPFSYSAWDEECPYDRITDRVVEWCQRHPDPIARPHDPQLHR
jgi:hypothetical protein